MNASTRVEERSRVGTREDAGVRITRLYRRHHRQVFALALRYGLGNESWAEDRTQDVFVELLAHLPKLDNHDQLGAWLYRVTTNKCLRKLRRERMWGVEIVRELLAGTQRSHDFDAVERRVFARDELEHTRRALAELPARERVVVCMVALDGKAQREVADILGLSPGYVSKLLARGTARLEEALRE